MRAEYVLYKSIYKRQVCWRARFCWDESIHRYTVSRALGISAVGRRENRREAEDAAEIIAQQFYGKNKNSQNTADINFIEYLNSFWRDGSPYIEEKAIVDKLPLSTAYVKNNQSYIRLHITPCPLFENISVSEFNKKIIRDYKLWCAKKGMSGRLINQCLQTISIAIRYMISNGDLIIDPFLGVSKAYHDEKKKGILTLDEYDRLIKSDIKDYYARLSVLLGCLCGMRRGEVRGLLWGDIGDGVIIIHHNWVDGDGAKNPKRRGGLLRENERTVPMPYIIADILNLISKIIINKNKDDFVIQSIKRKGSLIPVSAKYFDHAVKRELMNIGISLEEQKRRNLSFHSLRHTFVTIGRLKGISDLEIQALAGHSAKMMERYSDHKEAIDIKGIGLKLEQSLLI